LLIFMTQVPATIYLVGGCNGADKTVSGEKKKNGTPAKPLMVIRGERSWRRIARKIRADSKRMVLKPLVFK
jgi:hypothetical protein